MGGVAVAAALVAASFVVVDSLGDAAVAAAGCVLLVAISVVDLEERRIPNRIVLPGLVVALVARTALDPSVRWLAGALATGGILLVLALVYPAGLGMGDVKLAGFLGAWLGWNGILALLLGSFAGFVPAVGMLVLRGLAARKAAIPFGPFLAIGGVITVLAGDSILDWYRSVGG